VIHAGFAYPQQSLKSLLCLEGNRLSYELLESLGVPFKQSGKWIVAFGEEEETGLALMLKNAAECCVPGLIPVSPKEVAKTLPWLKPVRAAVFSETSGIMDTSEYIAALDRKLSTFANCKVLKKCRVEAIDVGKLMLRSTRGEMAFDIVINSAGLFADDVYRMAGGKRNFEIRPFKGEYYIWRKGPIEGLIYPVPDRFFKRGDGTLVSSMGLHLHRSISGDRYVGPSQVELSKDKKTDYSIETPPQVFADSAAHYLKIAPEPCELEPSQAGNRPKLFEDNNPIGDFVIIKEGPSIHLLGIESPGLTAAPAIARKVAEMI
jgi:L-2-hydroxyglutarate oxidase LhgO